MGQIRFKRYYTDVVEHFFRMTVRYKVVVGDVAQKWHKSTHDWIRKQSKEDKNLIFHVFSKPFRTTDEGLNSYSGLASEPEKRERLAALEADFAEKTNLI